MTSSCFIFVVEHMKTCAPEAGMKGTDKYVHPTASMRYTYLSLPLIPASGTEVQCHSVLYCYENHQRKICATQSIIIARLIRCHSFDYEIESLSHFSVHTPALTRYNII